MPERLRRTIRGLEKMIEPLRYHFDDLEKQARRKPMGIDLIATVEILHKNMARIEQELAHMRERVDMELILRNDSLSDESLQLPGETPPIEEDSVSRKSDSRDDDPESTSPRAFSATGNPFEVPTAQSNSATRTNDRMGDETLTLKPVKLGKQPPDESTADGPDTDLPSTTTTTNADRRIIDDRSVTRRDPSLEETRVLDRKQCET